MAPLRAILGDTCFIGNLLISVIRTVEGSRVDFGSQREVAGHIASSAEGRRRGMLLLSLESPYLAQAPPYGWYHPCLGLVGPPRVNLKMSPSQTCPQVYLLSD